MTDTPNNALADAMERATGEVLTANQRAFLLSLSPQTGLEDALYAATAALGDSGVEIDVLLDTRRARHLTEAALRAAAPILLAAKEREIETLKATILANIREYQDALKAHDAEYRRVLEDERTATDYLDFIEGCLKDAGFFYEGDPEDKILKREIPDRAERAIKGFTAAEARATALEAGLKNVLETEDGPVPLSLLRELRTLLDGGTR